MKSLASIMIASLAFAFSADAFSIPHLFWKEKAIEPSELHGPNLEKKVLIASPASEFKAAVVARIKEEFKNDSIYIKVTGLIGMQSEPAGKYAAIVIINTCMGWNMDPAVHAFLKKHPEKYPLIILTTSGKGTWAPRQKKPLFDAVSSASKKNVADATAQAIIVKIRTIMQR
jgi:hypothetical protein